jgi:hypothetical protein
VKLCFFAEVYFHILSCIASSKVEKNSLREWDSKPQASTEHLLPLGHFMSCDVLMIV